MSISYTGDPLWATRDALPSGNPDKQVVADDFRAEFDKISSAFALAAPTASPTFTGTVTLPANTTLTTPTLSGGTLSGSFDGVPTFNGRPTFSVGLEVPTGASIIGNGNVNITGNVTSTNVTATNVTASKHLISGVGRFESNAGDPSISRSEGQHLLTVSEEGIQKIGDPNGTQLAIAVGDGIPDGTEPYPIASLYMNSNPSNNVAANMLFLRVNNNGTNTDWVYFSTVAPPPGP